MSHEAGVIAEWEAEFAKAAGSDGLMSKDEFVALLGVKDAFIAARLFARFDEDGRGRIDRKEFIGALQRLLGASEDDKLRFTFELHDVDDSGGIDRSELAEMMRANLRENRLQFSAAQIDDLVERFFARSDTDASGDVSYTEFRAAFAQYPGLLSSLAVSPLVWLRPRQTQRVEEQREREMKAQRSWRRLSQKLLQNRMPYVIALGVYLALCVGVCVEAVLRHSNKNAWIQVARGAAAIVYLNGALIFVPMMRHFLTHLRHRRLLRALPFDEAVSFHRLCGHVMFFAGLVHTLAHFGNNAAILETPAGKTGLALLIVFAAMWGTALAFVRKGGHFRLFYLTHFLYVAWAALAIWHGPRFWMWLSLPLVGFLIERTWRLRTTSRAVSVRAGELLPSDVLALKVEKPAGFHYAAGSYLFLKCPQVSAFEWHPFTISSAPEDDALTVHIRAVGSWTGALYRLIKRRPHDVNVYIDGPYGAPAEEIFGSERAVLIGAGIGVTPFASVLRSILARKRRGDRSLGLERVRFFWLSREQRSFEWFLQLLSAIEREDDGLFELNVYLTGAESRHDLKSATLFIAMDMLHEATKVDLITGLESKTKTGRPDWPAIFQRIAEEDKGKRPATVFFCGPAGLGRELKALCRHHGLGFRQEAF